MSRVRERLLILSDFNIDVLRGYVSNDKNFPLLDSPPIAFGQVYQLMLNRDNPVWSPSPEFSLVWTRPESILPSFEKARGLGRISLDSILAEVDDFCEAVVSMSSRTSFTFVATWSQNPAIRGHGMLEMTPGIGVKQALMRANLRLAEQLADLQNIAVLDADRWISAVGKKAYDPRMWYLSKVPFDSEVFKLASTDLKAAIRGVRGAARKLIIVDLDDTLWGGIVGDEGWQNIRLGGHDAVGEAYVDFQRGLKALSRRGVLLGIVSKNTEEVALDAIRSHPEMVMTLEDFAGWRINWEDKAANVVDLVDELQLGLQSVVFIDDNPVERGRVEEALPEILVPDWPANKLLYGSALFALDCFDTPTLSTEDRKRSQMYSAERTRREVRKNLPSVDDWLKKLNVQVRVEGLYDANLARATQLLNKTNQMNLKTRRLTEADFRNWEKKKHNHTWVVKVSDRYGDSGLVGLISVSLEETEVSVVDFVLSCRAMGRRIEETMLHIIGLFGADSDVDLLVAEFIETAKNKPCLDFFKISGMIQDVGANRFTWQTISPYPLPETIQLIDDRERTMP